MKVLVAASERSLAGLMLIASHAALAQLQLANSTSDSNERGSLSPPTETTLPTPPTPSSTSSPSATPVGSAVTMSLQVTMLFVLFLLLLCLGVCCSVHALCRRYACCASAHDDSFNVLATNSRYSRGDSCFREDLLNDEELLRLWICWYCDFANYEMKLQCALCGNNKREKDAARKSSAVRPASLLSVSSASFSATTGRSFSSSHSPPSSSSLSSAVLANVTTPSMSSSLGSSSYFTPSLLLHAPLEPLPESPSTNNSDFTVSSPPGSPPGSPPPRLSAASSSASLSTETFANYTHSISYDQLQQHESFSGSRIRRREWKARVNENNHIVWSLNAELLAAAAAAASFSMDENDASKNFDQGSLLGSHSSFSSLFQLPSTPKTIEPIVQATAFVSRLSVPSSRKNSSPTTRYQHPHGVLRLEPAENARVYAALEAQNTDPSSLSCGVGPHAVQSVRTMSFPEKHRWFMQETTALLNVRWDSPGLATDTTLLVSRDDLLSSSVHGLMHISQKQLHRPLRVQFENEPGVDAGGIVREWFGLAVTDFLKDATGLFQCVHTSDDGLAYTISQNASIAVEAHLLHLRAFGRLLGKALLEGHLVAAPLTDVVFKHILGAPISFADLQAVDRKLAHSLQLLWETPLAGCDPDSEDGEDDDPYALDFSIYHAALGIVDLKPNGRNVKVTERNKKEYVTLFAQWHLARSVADEVSALVRGVYDVVPVHLLAPFDYQELRLLLCGSPTIDVDDWEAHTVVTGKQSRAVTRLAAWFWRAIRSLSPAQQSRILQFATGSARVPILGFKALTASDGRLCPFTIYCLPKAECAFLRAYTCFNRLDVPLYKSEKELESALALLLEMDVTGFSVQ